MKISEFRKLIREEVRRVIREANNDEQVIIQIGQQIDDKIYKAYLKFQGDKNKLANPIRAVGKLMKDEGEDENSIQASKEYKVLANLLGVK